MNADQHLRQTIDRIAGDFSAQAEGANHSGDLHEALTPHIAEGEALHRQLRALYRRMEQEPKAERVRVLQRQADRLQARLSEIYALDEEADALLQRLYHR
jgi:hypothetical protein